MKCAVALVVDTGLHAFDWTRAQAADYLRAQLAVDVADADLLTDRFVALPGSIACKMGELKIQALLTLLDRRWVRASISAIFMPRSSRTGPCPSIFSMRK